MPVAGVVCLDLPLVILSFASMGIFVVSHSFCQPSLAFLPPEYEHAGSTISLQFTACADFLPFLVGMAHLDSPAMVPNLAHARTSFPSKNHPRVDLLSTVSSITRCGIPFIVLDMFHSGPSITMKSPACSGSTPVASGMGCTDVLLTALDSSHFDTLSVSRSPAELGLSFSMVRSTWLNSSSFLFDFVHVEPPLLLHSFTCSDLATVTFGISRVRSPFFASDLSHCRPSMSVRSLACSSLVMFILNFVHMRSLLPLHSLACIDFVSSVLRVASSELLPLVLDRICIGMLLALQSCSYLELVMILLDLTSVSSMLALRSSTQLNSSSFIVSVS